MTSASVISIDVEWAHPEVLADVVALLDERSIRATFFCTHHGIDVPGHERALHPNFRRSGTSGVAADASREVTDHDFYRRVVSEARQFCPEAVGVRAHSLIYDSDLLSIYREAGLEYDSTYLLPLAANLAPVWKGTSIVELPIYYMDHWDLREQVTTFSLRPLRLGQTGLKVFDFHPNLIYLNAATLTDYADSRPHYHHPDWLRAHRRPGRGVRTLFLELLDDLAGHEPLPVLAEITAAWRAANRGRGQTPGSDVYDAGIER
jgi:hypothetical protein